MILAAVLVVLSFTCLYVFDRGRRVHWPAAARGRWFVWVAGSYVFAIAATLRFWSGA